MTDIEIGKLELKIVAKKVEDRTEEEKKLLKELSWRGYVNSCLIYDEEYHIVDKDGNLAITPNDYVYSIYNLYIKPIGEERAMELYREQKETFSKAKVIKNVATDGEGVSYNSVIWGD
jgi:hypothetical protein